MCLEQGWTCWPVHILGYHKALFQDIITELTVHFIAFLEAVITLVYFGGCWAVRLDIFIQVPAKVLIRHRKHKGVKIVSCLIAMDI